MVKSLVNKRGRIISVVNKDPQGYAIDSMIDPITRRAYVSVSKIGGLEPPQYRSFLLDRANNIIWSFNNKLSRQSGQVIIKGGFVPKDENGNEVIATHIAMSSDTIYISTTENKVRTYNLQGQPIQINNSWFVSLPTEITFLGYSIYGYSHYRLVGLSNGVIYYSTNWPTFFLKKTGEIAEYKQLYYPYDLNFYFYAALAEENTKPITAIFLSRNRWLAANSDGKGLVLLKEYQEILMCENPPEYDISFSYRKIHDQGKNTLYCLSSNGLLLIEDIPRPMPPVVYPYYVRNSDLSAVKRSSPIFTRVNPDLPPSCENAIANAHEAFNLMKSSEWQSTRLDSQNLIMLDIMGYSSRRYSGPGRYEDGKANQRHFSYSKPFELSYEGPYPIKKKCRVRIVVPHFWPRDSSSPDAAPNADFIMNPEGRVFSLKNPNEPRPICQSVTSPPEVDFSFSFLNPDAEDLILFSECYYQNGNYYAGACDPGFGCDAIRYDAYYNYPLELWDYIVLDFNNPNGNYNIQLDKEYHDVAIHPDDY